MPTPEAEPVTIERTVKLEEFAGMALRSHLFTLSEEDKGFAVEVMLNARPSHVYFEFKSGKDKKRVLQLNLAEFAQQLAIEFHEGRL